MKEQEVDPSSHRRKNSYAKVQFAQFDSMAAMAEQCKIPLDVLKRAKRRGCSFVHHGRCDLVPFLEWLFKQDMDEKRRGDWDRFDKKMSGLLKEEKLNQMRKATIKFEAVRDFLGTLVRDLFLGLLSRLAEEFPVKLKGKTDVQIAVECAGQLARVREVLDSRLEGWIAALRTAKADDDDGEPEEGDEDEEG